MSDIFQVLFNRIHQTPVSWYLAGGVVPSTCVGVYQAKGAASYAASLVNLINPGTNDAASITGDLDWSSADGWYWKPLATGITTVGLYPTQTWTIYAKIATAAAASCQFWGSLNTADVWTSGTIFANVGAYMLADNFGELQIAGVITTATVCIAGKTGYVNGISKGTIGAGTGTCAYPLFLCCYNNGGTSHGMSNETDTKWQAFAIYNTTHDSATVSAISTAMNAL